MCFKADVDGSVNARLALGEKQQQQQQQQQQHPYQHRDINIRNGIITATTTATTFVFVSYFVCHMLCHIFLVVTCNREKWFLKSDYIYDSPRVFLTYGVHNNYL